MPTVLISDATGAERLLPAPDRSPAHELSRLYQASLAACGFTVRNVLRPEIYATEAARAALGVRPGDWHLAVKPVEHLRPFHGLPNLFACDWPFPELSTRTLGGSPFLDQARLLRQADAVLCSTAFTADTLRRAGVARAVTLPPVVPPAVVPDAEPEPGCRFLCVVEHAWLRRQLGPTLDGFAAARAVRDDLHLHLRLRGGDAAALAALRERAGAGVTVADDTAPVPAAHCFLSAHAAPGLFLPLAAAAGAGLLPVTTRAAGTGSWLPADAAITVGTAPDLLDGDGEPAGRFMPLTSHPATAGSVRDAVLHAAALDAPVRARHAAAARAHAERHFGVAAFRDGLDRLSRTLPAVRR